MWSHEPFPGAGDRVAAAKRPPISNLPKQPIDSRNLKIAESATVGRSVDRQIVNYQNPNHFHHAAPAVSQITIFATEVTKPTFHQSLRDT